MDHERVASELLRALRGPRSQTALSRRLGYRSNVLYIWESGANYPTAAKTFRVMRRVGIDPNERLVRFYPGRPPEWLTTVDLTSREGVAQLMTDLLGNSSLVSLSSKTGCSRFALSRWVDGKTEPRLPDFLRFIEACTLRMLDFVSMFVDPSLLPSVAAEWRKLELARRTAYDLPWSHAVLRALELADYRALPRHQPGWIAKRLGISADEERQCLELLAQIGQIRYAEQHWECVDIMTVDTARDIAGTRRVLAWWTRQSAERLASDAVAHCAYNLCGVSERDYERLRELQRAYFAQLRAIVAESEPVQRVLLVNVQIFPLTAQSDSTLIRAPGAAPLPKRRTRRSRASKSQ